MKDAQSLVKDIVTACQEKKAKNITIINMTKLPGAICQYFVICEGKTPTQISAIAEEITVYLKANAAERPIAADGMREARWVAIDYGTVIVHIFLPELREFYDIEHLWADADSETVPDID
ncbi:MAG: ribosome silencing factor [Prevotella sp.]|jgi:ribosome-associated protein|nr:ribosome silencing factor [Prevotella sp.]